MGDRSHEGLATQDPPCTHTPHLRSFCVLPRPPSPWPPHPEHSSLYPRGSLMDRGPGHARTDGCSPTQEELCTRETNTGTRKQGDRKPSIWGTKIPNSLSFAKFLLLPSFPSVSVPFPILILVFPHPLRWPDTHSDPYALLCLKICHREQRRELRGSLALATDLRHLSHQTS